MSFNSLIQRKSSFNPVVITVTLFLVMLLLAATLIAPEQIQSLLNVAKEAIFRNFSWFYILTFSLFLFFLILLAISNLGSIKLGTDEEEPEFSFMSWLAMLFAAGMGVGLMFFGVAEPLMHYADPISKGQAQQAMLHTFFHWGIHAWSVYAVISLALAYFAFRYKLPLALRSCFYPLLKDKINSRWGDMVDILALVATLFGIITTLGFGAAQLGSGLHQIGLLSENNFTVQVVVIFSVMTLAVLSAISGVGKGVKILSETNLVLAALLMVFVLVSGPTLHLLSAFSNNLGVYISNLIELSFKTYVYEPDNNGWFNAWTIIYWAWWCSWAPFVGLFIARISRGRTVREFIFGVLAVPSLFCVLWFTVFGNSAIWLDTHIANGALAQLTSAPEQLLFVFLSYLPLPTLTSIVALIVISLFFITSADSGIYVLNNIASRDKSMASPKWQAVMWGVLMSVVAIALTASGGLAVLQTMTLITALPFTVLMIVMAFSLWKALETDKKYFATNVTPTSIFWSGARWKERLGKMLSQSQEHDILAFLKRTALPAMRELGRELDTVYGLSVQINTQFDQNEPSLELVIEKSTMRNFIYGIKSVQYQVAEQMVQEGNLPHIQSTSSYAPVTYFSDGRNGYDVQYMSREELIADILKQYERYLSLMEHVGQDIMAHEQTELAE
ncbi:BCCT family transporter [Neisseria sp. ZJ106]|uniref:BCCT family transporter n=1 Tax=Neisseria lisongii TaxID=2912188 RepID=A0ABY7RNH1_9NEIS|nr:BCCT family transporter [Neisseria lisongii]MCF7521831.1 BCCT family transporter [Neisseria lisongii]WCL71765.1 BCCT family transporter [Neisseria lisongii]